MSPLVPARDPHEGEHPWNGTCGPVRGDYRWCERRKREEQNRRAVEELHAERQAAGTCRHCGGPVPCWSPFGDEAPGRRRA